MAERDETRVCPEIDESMIFVKDGSGWRDNNGARYVPYSDLLAAEARVKELVAIAEQDAIDMASERAAFVQLRKALEESNERLRNHVKTLEPLAAAYREIGAQRIMYNRAFERNLERAEQECEERVNDLLDRAAEYAKKENQG